MIIDLHCHYTLTAARAEGGDRFSFEQAETSGLHAFDTCIAPRAVKRMSFRVLRRLLGIARSLEVGAELDRVMSAIYERHIAGGGPIDQFVLLAFDAYHDSDGRRPELPRWRGQRGSDIYTSNTLIRNLCRRAAGRFLFGASVHPYRENAVQCINEVAAREYYFDEGSRMLRTFSAYMSTKACVSLGVKWCRSQRTQIVNARR